MTNNMISLSEFENGLWGVEVDINLTSGLNFWMQKTIDLCAYSEDPSVQNAAIVTTGWGKFHSAGLNGLTSGVSGLDKWERPAKYMWVEHAERATIYQMSSETGGDPVMFCPWASCADCARAIVMAGITTLVRFPMPEADGWQESIQIGEEILAAGNITVIELDMNDFEIPEGLRLGQFRKS